MLGESRHAENFEFWIPRRTGYCQPVKLKLPVHAAHARSAGSRIVLATESRIASRSVSALHHHFPLGATRRSHGLYVDSPVTLVMRLFRAFTPGALSRPVIILVEIGRNNHATGKDKRKHPDTHQLIFHDEPPCGLMFVPNCAMRQRQPP
jgi:hypothetical protein